MRPILWLFFIVIAVFTGLFQDSMPYLAWWTCWITSAILYPLTIFGIIISIPTDRPFKAQLFRPYFLAFTFFTIYIPLSPIFYFLSIHGYEFSTRITDVAPDQNTLILVVKAQWFYLIAQISYVIGMSLFRKEFGSPNFKFARKSVSDIFLTIFIILQTLLFVSLFFSGLLQLALKLNALSNFLGVLFLGVAIDEKNRPKILVGLLVVGYALIMSFLSGWKSEPLFILILLGLILFQKAPKTIFICGFITFMLWLIFIPYYNAIYRNLVWFQEENPIVASKIARDETISADFEDLSATSWQLLYGRMSEISMHIKYIENIPNVKPFYGLEIYIQSAYALVPRILWADKPNIELLAMQRAYSNGVVEENSIVSAKPAFIADSYMSGGWPVIVLMYIVLGYINIYLSNKAESLFGSYLLGTGIIYNGLFQTVWFGNSFEFLTNTIFYSFLIMYFLHFVFKLSGILIPNPTSINESKF